jgi:uncharacterized protein YbgA (DUF1722 family)/uncharacterized protein YbbK (DUF523 family)
MSEQQNSLAEDRGSGPTIRLGVSTCLLGESVRYDGGHQRDRYLTDTLGQFVEWVPVCPEVEMGLSIPRPNMRLVGDPENPRLIVQKTGEDHTEQMKEWARERLDQLAEMDLHGFIFKRGSPSSGLFRVRVYNEHGMPQRIGTGIFPREVMKRFPQLPLEEEGRLHDMKLRENFIERFFAYERWTRMLRENPTPAGLVEFHTAHKLTIMAHSPSHGQKLGRLVAQAGTLLWEELTAEYASLFMDGLQVLASPGRHTNVLQHLMGFLKDALSGEDKSELLGLVEDYRQGMLPLIVPITLLKHHLHRNEVPEWVHQQVYLNPYPKELMLRNHV